MRIVRGVLAGLLVAVVAFATPLVDAVTALRSAVDSRVTAIGTPVGKPAKTESSQLAAASTALAAYGTTDLAGDVKALSAAAKALKASKTSDSGVIAAVGGAVACLTDVADQEITAAEQAAANLYHPSIRAAIAAALTQARSAATKAQTIAATDPAGALALLAKAVSKGTSAAQSAVDNANVGAPPADILWTRHSNSFLWITNESSNALIVIDVVYDADVNYTDGSHARVRSTASKLVPGWASQGYLRYVDLNETWSCEADRFREYEKQKAAAKGLYVQNYRAVAALRFKGRAGFFLPFSYNL